MKLIIFKMKKSLWLEKQKIATAGWCGQGDYRKICHVEVFHCIGSCTSKGGTTQAFSHVETITVTLVLCRMDVSRMWPSSDSVSRSLKHTKLTRTNLGKFARTSTHICKTHWEHYHLPRLSTRRGSLIYLLLKYGSLSFLKHCRLKSD